MRMHPLLVSVALAALFCGTTVQAFDGPGLDETDMPELAQAAPAPAMPVGPQAGGPAASPARPFSPQKMCQDQVARRIGNRAYLKARLNLKPDQMDAWNAFEKAADATAAKDKVRCASLPIEVTTPPSFTERLNMHEAMMKDRLASIESIKPSLLALYATLTPEQKEIMDRPPMGRPMMSGPHGRKPG